jgi:uridine kinase
VKPALDEFNYSKRKYADLIVPRGEENTLAVVLVSQYLKSFIKDGIGNV